jgi:hypothetical protein
MAVSVDYSIHVFNITDTDTGGDTNAGQLVPFIGAFSFAFAPESENNKTCILPGNGRLDAGPCPTELGPQLFSIFP